MKRSFLLLSLVLLFLLYGCGKGKSYDLPDSSVRFETKQFSNPYDSGDIYDAIAYNNRTYIPYGRLSSDMDDKEIEQCIGYMAQDDTDNTDYRVCTLGENPNHDYLIVYAVKDTLEKTQFLRATDTRHQKIETPPYIDNMQLKYWE